MKRGQLILGRLGLLIAALVVAALIGEMLLQLGAVLVEAAGREPESGFATADRRIVCLGDSNTYGLYLGRDEAYPQRLEERWNAIDGSPPIEVLNLGYPGTNSSTLLRELPRILSSLQPDGVLILIGVNESFTMVASDEPYPGLSDRIGAFIRKNSRLYLVYAMLRNTGANHGVVSPPFVPDPTTRRRVGAIRYNEHAFDLGFEGRKEWEPGDDTRLIANIGKMVAQVEASGASVALLTYAADKSLYALVNPVIREASAVFEAPLVDLSAAFSVLCPDSSCEALFFPDGHPTARGYELIADIVARQAPSLLGQIDD
jgi:lysophospholipase L1-like esterase